MKQQPVTRYAGYTAEQFMLDDTFIRWVLSPDAKQDAFWKSFLEAYPGKAGEVHDAREVIRRLVFEKETPRAGARQRVWQQVRQSMQQPAEKKVFRVPRYWRAAAAVLLAGVLLIGGYRAWNALQTVTVRTAYGEVKTVQLPDHSVITLNAHSSIRYKKGWDGKQAREVWLKGEAYFRVAHLPAGNAPAHPAPPFVVHTNNLNVEVLGTVFNVNDRHQTTTVVLQSGKVRLNFRAEDRPGVIMQPGEVVKYAAGNKMVRSHVNVSHYTSWTARKLEFNNTPLSSIIQMLRDNYGLEVRLKDPALASRTISGTLSATSEEVLLRGISTVLDIHIEKADDHTIVISAQ